MIVRGIWKRRLVAGIGLTFLVASSCTSDNLVNGTDSTPTYAVADTSSILIGSESTTSAVGADLSTASTTINAASLDGIIPPCTPLYGSQQDPCPIVLPPTVENIGVASGMPLYRLEEYDLTIDDIVSGKDLLTDRVSFFRIPHIVVRATVKDDTTRCELYPIRLFNYSEPRSYAGLFHYMCFVDVRVNEYLVGEGPSTLTVAVHRDPLILPDDIVWEEVKNKVIFETLEDPRRRTAEAYEGREAVMFLHLSTTLAVETWLVWGTYDVWFLRQHGVAAESAGDGAAGNETEASQSSGHITAACRDEQGIILESSLDDLTRSTKQAVANRNTAAAGSPSDAQEADGHSNAQEDVGGDGGAAVVSPPPLVTNAGHLRQFYIAAGAVYEGDDRTTVMPPPVPGQVTTSTTAGPTDEDTTSTTAEDTTSTTAEDTSTTAAPTSTATTVQVERPGTPHNVAVSVSGVVTWDPPLSGGPVTSYIVYVSGRGNIPTGPDDRSADISHWIKASKGSTIRVYVIAKNSSGWSRDSGIVTLDL